MNNGCLVGGNEDWHEVEGELAVSRVNSEKRPSLFGTLHFSCISTKEERAFEKLLFIALCDLFTNMRLPPLQQLIISFCHEPSTFPNN
jgi:hypothetical protein